MTKYLLSLLTLLFSQVAVSQTSLSPNPHVPLQPDHKGFWYDTERSGEGIAIQLLPVGESIQFFSGLYLQLEDTSPYFLTSQGDRESSWFLLGECPNGWTYCYTYPLYVTEGVNTTPVEVGSLSLHPETTSLLWVVEVDGEVIRDGDLLPLDSSTRILRCSVGGFGPHPPQPTGWCHW